MRNLGWSEGVTNESPSKWCPSPWTREGLILTLPSSGQWTVTFTVSHPESHMAWQGRHCFPHFIDAQTEALNEARE